MTIRKGKKWTLIVTASILGLILILLLIINIFLGEIIEGRINQALQKDGATNYHLSIEDVNINILSGNIRIKEINLRPDTTLLNDALAGKASSAMVFNLEIPLLRLVGVELIKAIFDEDIILKKIEFVEANIHLYRGLKPEIIDKPEEMNEDKYGLDTLKIKGIKGLSIGSIEFRKCNISMIDMISNDTLLGNIHLNTEFKGIEFAKIPEMEDLFVLNLKSFEFELINDKFVLPNGFYELSINKLKYSMAKSQIEIDGFELKPTYKDKFEMARKLVYTSEIFTISIGRIELHEFDIMRFLGDGEFVVDTLLVNKLNLAILMDKRLPFNENKRPKLPNQILKEMTFPIYIDQIIISESELTYQEQLAEYAAPMTAILGDFNVHIQRATSIKDSLKIRVPMTINLQAKLMKNPRLNIDFVFPLYQKADTFFYSGSLASSKMEIYNQAALPAMGVKFVGGEIKSITFEGSANPSYSNGTMKMEYDGLQGEVENKSREKNKFLSWAANSALHTSNPGKGGKLRVANMEFYRVPYKGFGNLMWKTLQNGIMNTILPIGKVEKQKVETGDDGKNAVQQEEQSKSNKRKNRKKSA